MAYDVELADRLRAVLGPLDRVEERAMFGGLAFLVGGHLVVAVSGSGGLLLRCEPEQTQRLLAEPGVEPAVMRGREMTGWVRVLPDVVDADAELQRLVDVGTAYAASLPPR